MKTASAYILSIPKHRHEIILDRAEENRYFARASVAEPVPRFQHSKRRALVVLVSLKEGVLTHIADGRKGASAGTGLVRLNMDQLQELQKPIDFDELIALVPKKFRPALRSRLENNGLLPPKTLAAVVDVLTAHDPSIAPRLARFSSRRAMAIHELSPNESRNLAEQKEALTLALEIAGLPKTQVLAWSPPERKPASFLEGLPGARVREDVMLSKDFTTLPGFKALEGASNVAAITFEDPEDNTRRLTVVMANRTPLEEQTGADLIYYNEFYRAFVMVQYKAMEVGDEGPEFRWQEGNQFTDELARMDAILAELLKCPPDYAPDGYRLSSNPFFLKFCSRVVFQPDDKGLFSGIYLPLDLWKCLSESGTLKGPRGGNILSFKNVGRRLTNTEFVSLVAHSWVGTTIPQSEQVASLIRAVLESGRTVAFAVKHKTISPSEDPAVSEATEVDLNEKESRF